MKSMFVVALLIAVVAVVCAEPCGNNADCANHGITTCGNQYHVVCHGGQCECTSGPNGHTCTAASDCTCNHQHASHPHCVDGHCHCAH